MDSFTEEEVVKTNLISRLFLIESDICGMIAMETNETICSKRIVKLDAEDIQTLYWAKAKINRIRTMMKKKEIKPIDLEVAEICTCPIHLEQFQAAGFRKLYKLLEADMLCIRHLLVEAESKGAKRLFHLHSLLHTSIRTR